MKQKIVLIASLFAGILAWYISHQHIKNTKAEFERRFSTVEILVASRDMPAGTILEISDIGRNTTVERTVGKEYFKLEHLNLLEGKTLRVPVRRGQPLLWSYTNVRRASDAGLSSTITDGMRAVSLGISGEAAVSNLVKPNDRVDILGTFTFPSTKLPGETETVTLTVLQDVTVLATGDRMARDELVDPYSVSKKKQGYSTMTFQVTPREAELLVFAQHVKGNLTLTLRNPTDGYFEPLLPLVDFEHVKDKLEEFNLRRQKEVWERDTGGLEQDLRVRESKDKEIRDQLDELRQVIGQ